MLSQAHNEQEFTRRLAKEFLDEGFQQLDPQLLRNELPAGYVPDLVLKRGDEILVVEIKSREEHRNIEQVRGLKQMVESNPNWKFKLYVVPSNARIPVLQDNLEDIEKLLSRSKQLNRSGEFEAASVMLWMAVEVALRTLLTNRQSRPNPGVSGMSMARSLLDLGELGKDEIELIDEAWRTRNLSVHGFRLRPRGPLTPELLALAQSLAKRAKAEVISNN
jgi:hypothetical protein